MTYQPLHHKYRPQTFGALVGQAAIATTLTSALQQQRIAPAYLFTGARGTGKTSSARILAKSLNCLASAVPTATPCGICEVCRAIAGGSALDVIEIDAASNTGVDNIRELIERSQFAPVQCRYKVYVIDECHMLSTAAFNALLKTLEEPPDRVVFVLATTDPQRVLPTIISRCQRFDFRRIPLDAMVQHLRAIADQEKIPIADEALTLVAQLSQGGLRDAESLLDQLSLLVGEVSAEKVWDLVGSVPERDLMGLLEAIAQDHPEALLDHTRRLMDRGREPMIVLQNLASFYRDLLIAKTAPQRGDLVALTPPTWQALCQFAQGFDTAIILAGQQHLRSCEFQLKNTTQPRLWLEVTLMGLLPSAMSAQQNISHQSQGVSHKLQSGTTQQSSVSSQPVGNRSTPTAVPSVPMPAVVLSPAPTVNVDAPPVVEAASRGDRVQPLPNSQSDPAVVELNTLWQNMLKQLQPPSTQMLLSQQACLLSLTDQEAHVGITTQWHNNAKTKLTNLETAFEKALQRQVKVTLEAVSAETIKAVREQPTSTSSIAVSHGNVPDSGSHSAGSSSAGSSSYRVSEPSSSIAPPTNQIVSGATNPNVLSGATPPSPAIAHVSAPSHAAPQPTNPASADQWQQEDVVTRAAKQLAAFFAGKVVDMTESEGTTAEQTMLESTVLEADSLEPEPLESAFPEPTLPKGEGATNPLLSNDSPLWQDPEEAADNDDDDLPF